MNMSPCLKPCQIAWRKLHVFSARQTSVICVSMITVAKDLSKSYYPCGYLPRTKCINFLGEALVFLLLRLAEQIIFQGRPVDSSHGLETLIVGPEDKRT